MIDVQLSTSVLARDVESLPALLARAAAGSPDAVALEAPDRTLSYRDLHAASSRLAGALLGRGVRPGDLVGLHLDRGADQTIAILAVLQAGAAYVPLDPSYPDARLRHIATDCRARVIVGHPEQLEHKQLGIPAIVPPDAEGPIDALGGVAIGPEDPAYVIYTSGSTGAPKGCVVTHGNVLSLLRAALPLFAFLPTDRWSLFHSYGFDFSVWELWGALATGAAAVVVPLEATADSLDFIRRAGITVLNQIPSVFRFLVRSHDDAGRPRLPLRHVIFGGEAVDLDVVRAFLAQVPAPGPVMVNMYGITEITVHATFKELRREDLDGGVRSPIGRALANLVIDVRDEELNPVPAGMPGELCISGAGVARGYLERPDLTAQRFVTVETAAGPRRTYRSGDLGRVLPDGQLEYLGRNDHQVKLRGFRIELGEIEAALRTHPVVRDVGVAVVETRAGEAQLVACVVADGLADRALRAELMKHAAAVLPGYMVPERYRSVERLPLTLSGKLDRRQLAALAAARP